MERDLPEVWEFKDSIPAASEVKPKTVKLIPRFDMCESEDRVQESNHATFTVATIVFFSGLTFSQSEVLFDPPNKLWVPGQGCPVRRCGARGINVVSDLRRHWREKHEEIVAKYQCTACSYVSKRKSNLSYHFRKRHGLLPTGSSVEYVEKVEYQHNQEYIDPYPLSLQIVLGREPVKTD
ncbi:hypothetical protein RRG08_051327 [Elysia crispata]|uniref:C2H2-type domain-containing protein n=1 Tax=Elysia crispata TaxID=231223 RepID=A0AAE1B375_9GAST|nr:hypothetical protein RRG08_051327 [Elysia crispata]